jgi:hypothetical protein
VVAAAETPKPAVSSDHTKVINYISSNINNIASSGSGSSTVSSFEFVDPDYVYVVYSDSDGKKKILLQYNDATTTISTSLIASFKPGETKDWDLVSGENEAVNQEKEIIEVNDSGTVTDTTSVKEGYRYFENSGVELQFPTNWYYGITDSSDSSTQYEFGSDPISDESKPTVTMNIYSGSVSASGTPVSINGKSGVKVTEGDQVYLYVTKDSSSYVKFSGSVSEYSTMVTMAESIN